MALFATDPSACLCRWEGDGTGHQYDWPAITIPEAWRRRLQLHGDRPTLRSKPDPKASHWRTLTLREWHTDASTLASGLVQLGLQVHDAVSVLGSNSAEWFTAVHGSIFAGAVPAGIYTTNSEDGIRYILQHSRSRVIFVDAEDHLRKALAVAEQCPDLRHIVAWGCAGAAAAAQPPAGVEVLTWGSLLALGKRGSLAEVERRCAAARPGNACYLSYTSGTTGRPKAVMFSHDNILYGFRSFFSRGLGDRDIGLEERHISFMPLSHVAGSGDIFCPLILKDHQHVCIYFAQPDAMQGSLPVTLREVVPTWFIPVPRVWQKLARDIELAGGALSSVGLQHVKWAAVGAAPPGDELFAFFESRGLVLHEIYAMTENTAVSHMASVRERKPGYVGKATVRGSIRLAPGTNEVLVRHRALMMGYMHDEKRTREAIDEQGWLHSGDVGELSDPSDPDSYLRIVGRIKELIITAGGENVAPVMIEQHLRDLVPGLSTAVVVGDRQKMLTALFTLRCLPDPKGGFTTELDPEARLVDGSARTVADAIASPVWRRVVEESVQKYNSTLAESRAQRIRGWAILPAEFSSASGELTPTLKLRREVVHKKYSGVIRALYGGDFMDVPWAAAAKL